MALSVGRVGRVGVDVRLVLEATRDDRADDARVEQRRLAERERVAIDHREVRREPRCETPAHAPRGTSTRRRGSRRTASASGTAYSGWFGENDGSSAERRVAAMYRFGSDSCGAVGASVENAEHAAASVISVHGNPRSARSSPSIAAQFAQIAGSA